MVRWTAVVCVSLCGGCAELQDERGPCGLTREERTIAGQRGLILTPAGLEPGEAAPVVLYHHGRGEDWDAIEASQLELGCALGASGYIVAGSHAHGNNWGSEAAIADYVALYDSIAAERPVHDVMFISVSMGGLTGLVTLARGLIPNVRAWAGISPVTNLGYYYFEDDGYDRQIKAAYGESPAPEHDPMVIDPAKFRGVPMLIWASPEDTRVPIEENAELFMAHLGDPPTARLVLTRGEHGDPSSFDPVDLVEFFDEHRGRDRTR